MRRAFLRLFVTMFLAVPGCAQLLSASYGVDLNGNPVHELAGHGIHVVVLIFASSDCPISNRYVPEIARLNREYSSRGVRIWWVFPNPEDTKAVVARHNQEFAVAEPTLIDTQQSLVRLAHATVTPEAAVFSAQGSALQEVYHGRIDDRYLSIGNERPQPSQRDLESAIASALTGKPVPHASEPPVGCAIVPPGNSSLNNSSLSNSSLNNSSLNTSSLNTSSPDPADR